MAANASTKAGATAAAVRELESPAADAAAATPSMAGASKALAASGLGMSDAQAEGLLGALSTVTTGLKERGVTASKNSVSFLTNLINQLDAALTEQLDEVMHDQSFLKLEGTWRGLESLLKQTDTNKTLWVEMADIAKEELHADLTGAADYSLTHLWRQTYDERYNTLGGKPFGAFVSGYEIENSVTDRELVKKLSEIGGAAHVPFILSASARLFGKRSFVDVKKVDDLKNTFNATEYVGWNQLRKSADSRFIALTLPRTLARLPYGSETKPAEGFNYEEAPLDARTRKPQKMPHEHLCWSSSAYAFGGVLTKAFRQTNWTTAIVGQKTETGKLNYGTVSDLPLFTYHTEAGNAEIYPPTEVSVPLNTHFDFAQMGLLPLAYVKDTDRAVFLGGKTLFEPQGQKGSKSYNNDFAASGLQNVLPASRIAHYLKVIGMDLHGHFAEADELKTMLDNWLHNYCPKGSVDERIKTQQPLKAYEVTVNPGVSPGVFDVSLQLQFWEMVFQINADVKMVAEVERTGG